MTEQVAIKRLQDHFEAHDDGRPTPFLDEAVSMAIKALEKQIPKKPIYSDFNDDGNDRIIPYKATCPMCGYEFEFGTWNDEENHHCVCGQKLDWSEV